MDSLSKIIRDIEKSFTPKKDDPKSKSPCSKCLGLDCGCFIASKRTPKKECKNFWNKDKKIVIEME